MFASRGIKARIRLVSLPIHPLDHPVDDGLIILFAFPDHTRKLGRMNVVGLEKMPVTAIAIHDIGMKFAAKFGLGLRNDAWKPKNALLLPLLGNLGPGRVLSAIGVVYLLCTLGLVTRSKQVITITQSSLSAMGDRDLNDLDKEKALQKNALVLFKLFLALAGGGALALLLPFALVYLCEYLGLLEIQDVVVRATSPTVIILSVVACFGLLAFKGKHKAGESGYSSSDRWLHRIAFSTITPQIAIADIESSLYKKKLAHLDESRPVFITGLPRSGTTLLLECCSKLPDMATHRYRDMPYLMVPCLWHRFSSAFKINTKAKQRSHGDGIVIDQDSPEALEEMLWLAFWKHNYRSDQITPWTNETNKDFDSFFRDHMKKIVFLRSGSDTKRTRYLSKNNLNIARTSWLRDRFPESTILVPFRPPLQHAASLLRQHNNFLKIQKDDPFALEYMNAIGHFDFGKNLKPINFGNWVENQRCADPQQLGYWLEYWVASYKHLIRQSEDRILFFDYQALCEHPMASLRSLGQAVDSDHLPILEDLASDIRSPSPHETETSGISDLLLQEAEETFLSLAAMACNRQDKLELAALS